MTLKFSIVDTKAIKETIGSTYTVYLIAILEVGVLDRDGVVVERRYSQFHTLHKGLLKEFSQQMKQVAFPKKKYLASSLDNMVIQERFQQLEKYLNCVYGISGVLKSNSFLYFFQLHHMKEAIEHLMCNRYEHSYNEYAQALGLAKKLDGHKNQIIWALCGMVETSRCQNKFEDADRAGTECLEVLNYDIKHSALFPMMKTLIDVRKSLRITCESLKNMYWELQKMSPIDVDSMRMLRELSAVPVDKLFPKS